LEHWQIWGVFGGVLVLLELILPGGIVIFLGLAAFIVAGGLYLDVITSVTSSFLTWFISSLIFIIFLRSFFMKYFEGDSEIQNVNEDDDLMGALVTVSEDVFPHKEGRVRLRDSTWVARSHDTLKKESKAIVCGREGNILIIKSI